MSIVPSIERFCFVNERDPESTLASVVEWRLGLIQTESRGFWSVRQTSDHLAAFASWVRRIHDSGLALSLVVDMRDARAQSQEIAEILQQSLSGLYRNGDRCAVVVPTSIAKLQIRRVIESQMQHHTFFGSLAAAEAWAMAYKRQPPGEGARCAGDARD